MFKLDKQKRAARRDENALTPLEIHARMMSGAPSARHFELFPHLNVHAPKRFAARRLTDDATLYSAGLGAETLVVAFGGKRLRPMVPVSVFLQMMDDEAFDVLALADRRRLHFDSGVVDWAPSLAALAARVARFAGDERYKAVISFGTSMGGLPALRAGRLMGADRAISIGGRFAWHIPRLDDGAESIAAFDQLCACVTASAPCLHVYAAGNQVDAENTERLVRTLPSCEVRSVPLDGHNVVDAYYRAGTLGGLLSALLDLGSYPTAAALEAMLPAAGPPDERDEAPRRG